MRYRTVRLCIRLAAAPLCGACCALCAACRCGPMDIALSMLECHAALRALVNAMTQHVFPIGRGEEAMETARAKGMLKVQLSFE